MTRQLRVRRDDPELLLPGEHLLPVGVPAIIEQKRIDLNAARFMQLAADCFDALQRLRCVGQGHPLFGGDDIDEQWNRIVGRGSDQSQSLTELPPDGSPIPEIEKS